MGERLKWKDVIRDEQEALRELRNATLEMFAEGATQDGNRFHFDFKRADRVRTAALKVELTASIADRIKTTWVVRYDPGPDDYDDEPMWLAEVGHLVGHKLGALEFDSLEEARKARDEHGASFDSVAKVCRRSWVDYPTPVAL